MKDFYFATTEEMEHLDKLAVEHGLEIRQMMEVAGLHMLKYANERRRRPTPAYRTARE